MEDNIINNRIFISLKNDIKYYLKDKEITKTLSKNESVFIVLVFRLIIQKNLAERSFRSQAYLYIILFTELCKIVLNQTNAVISVYCCFAVVYIYVHYK
jgi:hypothetical protein